MQTEPLVRIVLFMGDSMSNRMSKTLNLALGADPDSGEFQAAWYRMGQLAKKATLTTDQMWRSFEEEWKQARFPEAEQAAWNTLIDGWFDAE